MADARLEEHALPVLALRVAQDPLVHTALFVEDVFVFLLADDVVQDLLLGIHLGVVEGPRKRLFAAEPRGDGGDACADGKHFWLVVKKTKKRNDGGGGGDCGSRGVFSWLASPVREWEEGWK